MKTVTTLSVPVGSRRRKRRVVVRVIKAENAGEQFEVQVARVTLGRSRECHVALVDPSVSAVHAELRQMEDHFELHDFGSRNGTRINDRRVRVAEVRPGDIIQLGDAEIELVEFVEVDVPIVGGNRFGEMFGTSEIMREAFGALQMFAQSDVNVLLTGETGTGKELSARALHEHSRRAHGPFIVVDCGGLQPALAASALFGHRKGSFTGAVESTPGAFELAAGGTVFLDEVGELELGLQQLLLRVLEAREVRRVGEHEPRPVNIRVVSATHRNLAEMVHEGSFRQDLFFRLVEGEVELPPLRHRREDIPLLTQGLLARECQAQGSSVQGLTTAALKVLQEHMWPGNVRELRNAIRTAVAVATVAGAERIGSEHIKLVRLRAKRAATLEDLFALNSYSEIIDTVDRVVLSRALAQHGGRMTPAASAIGLGRKRFRTRMIELGLLDATSDEAE